MNISSTKGVAILSFSRVKDEAPTPPMLRKRFIPLLRSKRPDTEEMSSSGVWTYTTVEGSSSSSFLL